MSKPIKLTEDIIEKLTQEFREELSKSKMFNGKIDFSKTFSSDTDRKITVSFSSTAFTKMLALVMNFDDEVAWHGLVDRLSDDLFYIEDILVYPQTVSGATVNTDQDEYTKWLYAFDDEDFNSIRMQGHSHVNMSVSPSSTDLNHQESILQQLTSDDYYIFIIWNKKMDYTIRVFDLNTNTMYENNDVNLLVEDQSIVLDDFIKDSKKLVSKTITTNWYGKDSKSKSKSPYTYQGYYVDFDY